MAGCPDEQRANALLSRGDCRRRLVSPDYIGAIDDCSVAAEIPGASISQRAAAFLNRGVIKLEVLEPDVESAISDFDSVLGLEGVSLGFRSEALAFRGLAKSRMNPPDFIGATADYFAVLAIPGVQPQQVVGPMFNLSCLAARSKDTTTALHWLRKWREVCELPGRHHLDADTDFDEIRLDPKFIEFRESLPSDTRSL